MKFGYIETVLISITAAFLAVLGFHLFSRTDIEIDKYLNASLLPYVILFPILGSIVELSDYHTILFGFAYFPIILGLTQLYRFLRTEFREEFHSSLSVTGFLLVSIAILTNGIPDKNILSSFLIIAMLALFPLYTVSKFQERIDIGTFSFIAYAAHILDATSTFVILKSGGYEQHILGRAFINVFGAPGIFLMKLIVAFPVIFLIDRSFEGIERRYYLGLIACLGILLTVRNLLTY